MAGGGNRDAGRRLGGCLTLVWAPRELYLALGVGLWLTGYFVADGWEQQRAFKWLLPVFLLNGDLLVKSFRETPWLWAGAALLAYQGLSRVWSSGSEPVSNWLDVGMVLLLMVALIHIGRSETASLAIVGGLTLLCAVVTLYSLIVFYGRPANDLAGDRLRNMLIYGDGLNAVLTGMLCGFGALGAAWFSRRDDWRAPRLLWLTALAVLVFGLMAAQSRGALLAAAVGLGILLLHGRLRLLHAAITVVVSAGAWFVAVRRAAGDGDLVERGSAGRFAIYEWFLERVTLVEGLVGRGMASEVTIPEEELGWFVHHPHSSYLTQFLLTGVIGLAGMLVIIAWAGRRALAQCGRKNPFWFALLASGAVAMIFDCAQMFSLYSAPRLEFLLVVVPAALVMGREVGENKAL